MGWLCLGLLVCVFFFFFFMVNVLCCSLHEGEREWLDNCDSYISTNFLTAASSALYHVALVAAIKNCPAVQGPSFCPFEELRSRGWFLDKMLFCVCYISQPASSTARSVTLDFFCTVNHDGNESLRQNKPNKQTNKIPNHPPLFCSGCIFKKIPPCTAVCLCGGVKTGLFCRNEDEDLEGHLLTSWQVSLHNE